MLYSCCRDIYTYDIKPQLLKEGSKYTVPAPAIQHTRFRRQMAQGSFQHRLTFSNDLTTLRRRVGGVLPVAFIEFGGVHAMAAFSKGLVNSVYNSISFSLT